VAFRIAINGFGRIGRQGFRALMERYPDIEVVAVNDLGDAKTATHLFKYDSTYGRFPGTVTHTADSFTVNGKTIKLVQERDPSKLPWKAMGVDLVIESTGFFTDATKAKAHIDAGAKRVIISAPAKNEDITIVLGVNEDKFDASKHFIISNASCTTNCLAPVTKVLLDELGIVKGTMTTIHSYTNDQRLLDFPHEDLRRARAAALNIIPTTTGAAKAIYLGVPTPTVSIVDLVVETEKQTTKDDVNALMRKWSESPRMKDILGVTDEPLVSMDFRGDSRSSIVDSLSTMVVGGNLVKVYAWYDNEWGYSCRIADLTAFVLKKSA
jgi:glyceraldehyde 3-phosphate dehydrogenase